MIITRVLWLENDLVCSDAVFWLYLRFHYSDGRIDCTWTRRQPLFMILLLFSRFDLYFLHFSGRMVVTQINKVINNPPEVHSSSTDELIAREKQSFASCLLFSHFLLRFSCFKLAHCSAWCHRFHVDYDGLAIPLYLPKQFHLKLDSLYKMLCW